MALTKAIEKRLDQIQKDVNQGMVHDQGQVLMSAADINWLLLVARNAVSREPVISRKNQRLTRIVLYIFISAVSLLSLAGIAWGIKALIKLI
jgi:hypothetical protein